MSRGAPATNARIAALDLLRALAAIFVVAIHSVGVDTLRSTWAVFHVWQAVPLFIVVMGASAYVSLDRRGVLEPGGLTLLPRQLLDRTTRLLLPFSLVWLYVLGLAIRSGSVEFGPANALLMMPISGPGNYFVPIALELALLAPLVARGIRRAPVASLAACAAVTAVYEVAASAWQLYEVAPYLYDTCALRYLVLFACGMWSADRLTRRRPTITPLVLAYAAISVAYIAWVNVTDANGFIEDAWRWQNLIGFGYVLLILGWSLEHVGDRLVLAVVRTVSQASYHVFLVQMAYFLTFPLGGDPRYLPLNILVCVVGGIGFFKLEAAIRTLWKRRKRGWMLNREV